MIWNDDLCRTVVNEMNAGPTRLTWAQEAQILSDRFGEYISLDQVRGAIRRFNDRQGRSSWDAPIIPVSGAGDVLVAQEPYIGLLDATYEQDDPTYDVEYENATRFPSPVRIAEQPIITVEDPNVLIISDIHAPYHSPEMLERAVHIAHKYFPHVRQAMIIGDIFDFAAISNHLNNQPVTSTEVDMRAGGKITKEVRAAFDDLYIGPGNHDERISKKLNSDFSMESLLCGALGNTDPGLHITDLDYFYIGDDIIAGHPTMYSSKPTGVAAKVALMQRKNTITGHSHKVGITVSDDGIHWTIDNGHCANPELFYYVRRRMSTFGKMGAGFTILSNGKPFVFGDAITDWSFWK